MAGPKSVPMWGIIELQRVKQIIGSAVCSGHCLEQINLSMIKVFGTHSQLPRGCLQLYNGQISVHFTIYLNFNEFTKPVSVGNQIINALSKWKIKVGGSMFAKVCINIMTDDMPTGHNPATGGGNHTTSYFINIHHQLCGFITNLHIMLSSSKSKFRLLSQSTEYRNLVLTHFCLCRGE